MDFGSLSGDAGGNHDDCRIRHGTAGCLPCTRRTIRKLDQSAVMGLPVALLGAMLGCYVMGTPVSIYTQIGIILLVALSAKNGILIVEFARDFRAQGNSIRDAAFQAGHIRLRPILMTSLAFVFGVMPLLFATGAGAGSRIALGAAVVFGMALNTLLATVYIPNFYELMQKLQEKFSKKQ